jgi:hypothetical protein
MNKIKLAIIAAALIIAAVNSQAQLGAPTITVRSASTSGAYAAVTNNTTAYPTNAIIDCSGRKDVSLAFLSELSGAGTTANTVVIQQSVDRSNWATHTTFTATPAGTTPVLVVTNLAVGGIPYLRIYSIANANANTGYITNYTVKAFAK